MDTYIVVVEDDHVLRSRLEDHLRDEFPKARIDGTGTEREFTTDVISYRNRRPDVVIIDVMLRWTNPRPGVPPIAAMAGYQRAGVRCLKRLFETKELRTVPVILHTGLAQRDLDRDLEDVSKLGRVIHVQKAEDLGPLLAVVRSLVVYGPSESL